MSTLLSENFDAITVGTQPPTGWSESGTVNSGLWSVQTAPAGMSGRVARSEQRTTSTLIGHSITRQTSGLVTVTWTGRAGSVVTSGRRWGELQFRDGAGNPYFAAIGLIDGQVRIVGSAVSFVGTLVTGTVYALEATLDLDNDKVTQVVVNGTTFNNAGAGWAFVATTTGFDNLKIEASSPTVVAGQFVYFDVPVVTNTVVPGAGTLGAGTVDEYGRVTMTFTEGTGMGVGSTIRVYRSNDGTNFADAAATCTLTDNGSTWTITDRRPHYGSEAVAYGGTAYYKVVGVDVSDSPDSNTVTVTNVDVDIPTIKLARAAVLSGIMAGGTVASSSTGEPYPGYWVQAMAEVYREFGTAQYKTDCLAQFDLIKNSYTLVDGLLQFPDYADKIYRDLMMRTVAHCALAARLLRRAGATTDAQTITDQCDVWAKAFFDALGGGTPLTTKTIAGYDATNATGTGFQHARVNSTAVVLGQIIKDPNGNARTWRATTAGTTAGSAPTFPNTNGASVTDGTVTWTETTVTVDVPYYEYSESAGHAGLAGTDFTIPNQFGTVALAYALLITDPDSDFYTAGAYRTKAETLIADLVDACLALETSAGAIPRDNSVYTTQKRGYDTLYGNFTLQSLSCVYTLVPDLVSPFLPGYISRGLSFASTNYYGTEPVTSVRSSEVEPGATSLVMFYDMLYLDAAAQLTGATNPQAHLPWTAAFQIPASGKVGWPYSATGSPANGVLADASQAQMFDGLAFAAGVLDPVPTVTHPNPSRRAIRGLVLR